jgi:hypothetical protein
MPMVHPDSDAFASDYGHGLTKREYIATQCLASIVADAGNHFGAKDAAEKGLGFADALLQLLAGEKAPAVSVRPDPADIEEDDRVLDLDELDRAGVEDGTMD